VPTLPDQATQPIRFAPLISLLAGLASVFAFAPFGVWPVQIITQAVLFFLLSREATLKRALFNGWAFGFGCFVFGVYWPYVSMHDYGYMPVPLAGLAVVLFALLLGSFSAIGALAGNWLRLRWQASNSLSLLVIFPSTWTLSEWLRDWLFTGFPWLSTGYAHTVGPLAGFAPVMGVFGIGWIAAIIAGCLSLSLESRRVLTLGVVLLAAGFGLKMIAWTHPSGQPITVRLLQGNVPQDEKFQATHERDLLAMYDQMLRAKPADLIATPETAITVLPQMLPPDYLPQLVAFSKQTQSHLALGIVISDKPGDYTNSLIDLSPQLTASNMYRYDKHHLVPFGEFVPYGFRWFVDALKIPLGELTSGPMPQHPFAVKDQQVLPNICYEDLFGEEIAEEIHAAYDAKLPQPTILLNVSNMAWFGQWLAVPQHLQTSQMRAMETGRPALRATNTGATAVISPFGEVQAELTPYTRDALGATVQGYTGLTPYVLCGNKLVVGLALLSLVIGAIYSRKKRAA
jgi:apolipoprotein N-acyltransferase